MPEPACHYCDHPARAECPTCGRLYCEDHGDDVCLRCMAPESATPAAWAYRGSIVALALASLVVLFLIIRPPASSNGEDTVRTVATTAPIIGATATPTPRGSAATATRPATPAGSPVGTASPSAAAGSPTPAPTQGPTTYTVKSGDTLGAIAAQFNTTVAAIVAANPGLSPDSLQIGLVLKIPQ